MKQWNRLAHSGVTHDFDMLIRALREDARYEFGSSGEGEITVRPTDRAFTAYVRKYKVRDGWRLSFCRGKRIEQVAYPDSLESVIRSIRHFA